MASKSDRVKKIKEQQKKIKSRSEGGGNLIFFKADETVRLRCLPVAEDEAFGLEIIQFYLGSDIKGVISPTTFEDMPCAIMEKYEELKASADEDDAKLLESLKPKTKYVVPVIKYKDLAGKEIDEQKGVKLALLTGSQYNALVDYYMDDEHGDFTDPKEGYDLKFSREGKTMMDTKYSVMNCKVKKLAKKYNKIYNLEELLMKEIPSYEETQDYINQFMGTDDKPKKKKSKKGKKVVKKKK